MSTQAGSIRRLAAWFRCTSLHPCFGPPAIRPSAPFECHQTTFVPDKGRMHRSGSYCVESGHSMLQQPLNNSDRTEEYSQHCESSASCPRPSHITNFIESQMRRPCLSYLLPTPTSSLIRDQVGIATKESLKRRERIACYIVPGPLCADECLLFSFYSTVGATSCDHFFAGMGKNATDNHAA
ncbi:hypothetical protein BCR37DRAFT_240876 [Protomyces lactucae-debilis]|uniref:Uncharacterized protein n=1 Tax=Protomyces lactucae-debilis TaxID=2754530 RepID=A0A1Y2FNM4_PROLT|nr:uncharacterized protein BCR37DRAFT_240876 [Protomyces lactucae-debilis]ORY85529.1 hypothetical protein BCR37DRAFT_240876 [Protomyces lactucae-debilis]